MSKLAVVADQAERVRYAAPVEVVVVTLEELADRTRGRGYSEAVLTPAASRRATASDRDLVEAALLRSSGRP